MPHDHSHHHTHLDHGVGDRRLLFAVALNLLLTVVEVVAGVWSGSLALVADAVHNFNDCASLVLALVARRIGRWPSDERRTFGYRRVETIGALVNLTALVMISAYLVYEAFHRWLNPQPIDGWVVIIVASVALAIDVATALLLLAISRGNLNLRAAFLHNVGDALSSVGVIFAGVAVLLYDAAWVDVAVTLAIAAVILWQCLPLLARAVQVLLQSVPPDIALEELVADLHAIPGVVGVHHVHVWEMDEEHRSLEAHVVVADGEIAEWTAIKSCVKQRLRQRYGIQHSTLELETPNEADCDDCPHTDGP